MNVGDHEKKALQSTSPYNDGEVACVTDLVHNFLDVGIDAGNIGVIAMYKTQAERLHSRLDHLGIACGTVDSFQGQEKDIMLVSCVRSNPDRNTGFLDGKRINVAITRANTAWRFFDNHILEPSGS